MAPGDVSITRGVGFRDDALDAVTGWGSIFSLNVGPVTQSDDDDIATLSVQFNSASSGNFGEEAKLLAAGPSTTTYPKIIIRQKKNYAATNPKPRLRIVYTDTTESLFDLTQSQTFFPDVLTLVAGKTVQQYGVRLEATGVLNGTFTMDWDFIFIFKETLTLPAVSQPLQFSLPRTVVELPIPTREGGVVQDIGSDSASVEIAGALLTTTSPNNYTAEQWWDVLVGTWLEGNWQWLSSDRVNYKYQIEELTVRQDPGKVSYYEFKMRLKKVDILSATAQTYGAIQ